MWVLLILVVALIFLPVWLLGNFFTGLLWLAGFALVAGGCSALMEKMKDE